MYYPPEVVGIGKYSGELVKGLKGNGHDVVVLTTFPFYPYGSSFTDLSLAEEHKDEVFRIRSFMFKTPSTLCRIVKSLSFAIGAFIFCLRYLRKVQFQYVIVVAPPFINGWFVKYLYPKAVSLYHVQDLEIEAALGLGMASARLLPLLNWIEKWVVRRFTIVSTISDFMAEKLASKHGIKEVHVFQNWASVDGSFSCEDYFLHNYLGLPSNTKLVVYSGSIGKKQGFDLFLEMARIFALKYNDVHFVVVSSGNALVNFRSVAENMQINNISFLPFFKDEDFPRVLRSSFVQLVLQKPGGKDSFMPSKLANILASGSLALVVSEEGSYLSSLVKQYKLGVVCEHNVTNIIEALEQILGGNLPTEEFKANARSYSKKNLDFNTVINSIQFYLSLHSSLKS